METFIKEQIIHLVKKILSYNSDIEQKDFESTFDEYERILNESDHIYKYMYALDRLIHQLENEKI